MIIGICGLIGSGKDTVADILVQENNFKKLSFADKLKDGVSAVFGWDRVMLEGNTEKSRAWREQEDTFWTNETGRTTRVWYRLYAKWILRRHMGKSC
jgi:broad-specificity NMP kinase